jgi:hypothetical protein
MTDPQKTPGKKEIPALPPPVQLEQEPNGMWVYWQDAWQYGTGITKNGIMPVHATTREQAEEYVNNLHPGSFPEKLKKLDK